MRMEVLPDGRGYMPQWRVPAGMGFEHLEMEAAQVPLSFPFFLFLSLFLSSPIASFLHSFIIALMRILSVSPARQCYVYLLGTQG